MQVFAATKRVLLFAVESPWSEDVFVPYFFLSVEEKQSIVLRM